MFSGVLLSRTYLSPEYTALITWKMPRLAPGCCSPPIDSILAALLATKRQAPAIASGSEEYFYLSRADLELSRRLDVALELCSELLGGRVDIQTA